MQPISPEFLFNLFNSLVLPAWILLILFPGSKISNLLLYKGWFPGALALAYLCFLIVAIVGDPQPPDFGSIEGVKAIFSSPWGVLTGWIHYLCFDLLVGMWISRHALKHRRNRWITAGCLFFCFMLGPVGFALYGFWNLLAPNKNQSQYPS
jgi:hypothetical protein